MSAGGYYDIDSILSEEVRVPCVFALDAVGMGMLDPTTSDEDLSQGAKVRRRVPLLLGPNSSGGNGKEEKSLHRTFRTAPLCSLQEMSLLHNYMLAFVVYGDFIHVLYSTIPLCARYCCSCPHLCLDYA